MHPSHHQRNGNQQNNTDPLVYASALNGMLADRNPIQALVGDISRMIKVITNLGKTRKMAQMRIEQLQKQVSTVESQIAEVNPQTQGTRINKLR